MLKQHSLRLERQLYCRHRRHFLPACWNCMLRLRPYWYAMRSTSRRLSSSIGSGTTNPWATSASRYGVCSGVPSWMCAYTSSVNLARPLEKVLNTYRLPSWRIGTLNIDGLNCTASPCHQMCAWRRSQQTQPRRHARVSQTLSSTRCRWTCKGSSRNWCIRPGPAGCRNQGTLRQR